MGQFTVLKEVYTINDDCDQLNEKNVVSIDDFDPLCSNISPWTMTPQVSIYYINIYVIPQRWPTQMILLVL